MKFLFNFKSCLTINEIKELLNEASNLEIINDSIFFLNPICCFLSNNYENINFGIQGLYFFHTPVTSTYSINQLKAFPHIKYVLLNHSEMISYLHFDNYILNEQIKTCIENHLIPIICFGEDKLIKNQAKRINKLHKILNQFSLNALDAIYLAYEPEYLVNSNLVLNIDELYLIINQLKDYLYHKYPNKKIEIYYGGNVNKDNIQDFIKLQLDGLLIGRYSLDINNLKLLNKIKKL